MLLAQFSSFPKQKKRVFLRARSGGGSWLGGGRLLLAMPFRVSAYRERRDENGLEHSTQPLTEALRRGVSTNSSS